MDLSASENAAGASETASPRMTALDALRGIAILMMTLSGVIPFDKPLPAWMYHAQEPPPTHDFNANLPGLTWVDLVFPIFLFCMGAAIPISLSHRIEKGGSALKITGSALIRGATLAWFAVFLQHIRPYAINAHPTTQTWLISIYGFALLFLMFIRIPVKFPKLFRFGLPCAGYLGAILLLLNLRYPAGSYSKFFTPDRNDIILIVLANMAVFGTLIWLITRKNQLARLAVLPLYLALRLSATQPGWIKVLWKFTPMVGDDKPLAFLFNWDWLKYLFIVIPGTIAGDMLVKWISETKVESKSAAMTSAETSVEKRYDWHLSAFSGIAICLMITSLILALLIGLEGRHVWQTMLIALGISASLAFLTNLSLLRTNIRSKSPPVEAASKTRIFHNISPDLKLIEKFVRWAVYWLILGLLFEPFEGGIKKDSSTLSYYFVTTAISLLLLTAFFAMTRALKSSKILNYFAAVGQNPMIGYCAMGNLIQPILALTTLEVVFASWTQAPWSGVFRAVCETLTMGALVALCTRLKLFWRT